MEWEGVEKRKEKWREKRKMNTTCEVCNEKVSPKVEAYSKEHFNGKVLCYDCQQKARGKEDSWTYQRPEDEEEKKEDIVDVAEASEEETSEDDKLKTEARKVDYETIRLVTDMAPQDKDEFYAWLKQVYGVDDLETLNIEQKREVLEQTKIAVQKREEEKGADVKQGEVKQEEDTNQPGQQEEKKIEIDWEQIPKQIIIPKLRKALEYVSEDKTGFFAVIKANFEGKEHRTTRDSCDCEDFLYRGTSLNPCVHQIRIKYTDEEILATLKELGAGELRTMRKKSEEIEMREKIVDIAVQEPIIDSDMMITGMKPQLAELGKIKIGVKGDKMVRGHLLPKKLDHFMIATLMKDDEGRLEMDAEMNKIIGEKCTSLDICLCYDDFTMNMTSSYSWFAQSKLVCMGNGQTAMRRNEDGSEEKIICNPKECTAYKEKKCLPYGRLSVILASANRIGGVYVLRTHGWNTIRNVLSSMAFIRKEAGGVLAGLPLRMQLLPMTVTPRDVGRNVKIYSVNIEYPGTLAELKEAGAAEIERRLKLGINMKQTEDRYRESVKARMKEEAEEDARDIAEEFGVEGEG